MSQENVKKTLRAYGAWNRRDFDAALEFGDPVSGPLAACQRPSRQTSRAGPSSGLRKTCSPSRTKKNLIGVPHRV